MNGCALSAEPLHHRIRRDLEERIRGGQWPVGTRVPTEAELEREYGVSRTTVQRALYDLTTSGLVVRRRRHGTFVAQAAAETNLLRFVNLFLQDPVSPGVHEPCEAKVILARDSELNHADLDPEEALVRLERLKLTPSGAPAAVETTVIPFRLVPNFEEYPWDTGSSQRAIRENGHALARVRLYVEPCGLSARSAKLLRLRTGEPALRCLRYTWLDDGSVAEISEYLLAPEEYKLYVERSLDDTQDS